MNKLKNRKRLSLIALAFLLVFLSGAAFAFAPGTLTIGGLVNFSYDYVVWETAEPGELTPGVARSAASILDMRGREAQHISWEIDFEGSGTTTLVATPFNRSATAARLDEGDVHVASIPFGTMGLEDPNATWTAEDFGLVVTVYDDGGQVIPPNSPGEPVTVVVTWAGVAPEGFDPETTPPHVAFLIAMDYTVDGAEADPES